MWIRPEVKDVVRRTPVLPLTNCRYPRTVSLHHPVSIIFSSLGREIQRTGHTTWSRLN